MSGEQSRIQRQPKPWTNKDGILLLLWAFPIIPTTVIWNQFVFQPGLDKQTLLLGLVGFIVGVPFVFGAMAGGLLRRDGPWLEVLLTAFIGAACISLTLFEQWINDPRACVQGPDSPCDISLGISMVLSFAVCFVPFLAGAAMGKGVLAALRAITVRRRSGAKDPL